MATAARRLGATPAFTLVALTSLALGIGLNIVTFSFTSPALFKALPYPEAQRLLDIGMAPADEPEFRGPLTPALYVLLRDRTGAAFDAVGVFDAGRSANLAGDAVGPAERLAGHRITATGLAALGTAPLLGRLPVAADEQAATPTMVISYQVWQRRFAGRPDVVNQTVQVDGEPTRIVGVMPEGFGLLDNSSDAWFTVSFEPIPGEETDQSLYAIGRLEPGVSIAQAQVAVDAALDEYARMFPDRGEGWTVELTPWREARFGDLRRPLATLQLAVAFLLVLLCVNLAVPLAVHASRERPAVVLTESLMLVFGGGVVGLVLAWLALPTLRAIAPGVIPRLDEVAIDAGVLAFTAALCVLAALVIGIVPAWQAWRAGTTGASGSSGHVWRGRLGATVLVAFVAVQLAIAFVLLAATGLAIRGVAELRGRDVGIDPAGLLSADVHLPLRPYVTPGVAQAGSVELADYDPAGSEVYDRIRAELQSMPGVVDAAGVGSRPFASAPFVQLWIESEGDAPQNRIPAQYLAVTENYFNTMGIRVVRGRDFSPADRRDSPWVVLVNEAMARKHWPNGDPLGQRLKLTFHPNDDEPPREIIGVVADTLPFRAASEVAPLVYLLHRQQATRQRASFQDRRTVMSFIARAEGDPLALGGDVRAVVSQVDPATPVSSVQTVESYLDAGQVTLLRSAATFLGMFAFVALVTGAAGSCGLASYDATGRRATLATMLRAVAAVAVGAAVGLAVWLRLGDVIAEFLTNLSVMPSDPLPLAITGVVVLVTVLVACLIPVRRVARASR